MPIYEYRCRDCAQLFEEWQKDYQERSMPCPVCGGGAERLISNTSFVLKGGGWYADLYSKGGSKPGEASSPTGCAPAGSGGNGDCGAKSDSGSATASTSTSSSASSSGGSSAGSSGSPSGGSSASSSASSTSSASA